VQRLFVCLAFTILGWSSSAQADVSAAVTDHDAGTDDADADDGPLPIEVGVYGGGFISNYFHQFYNTGDFPGGPGDPNGREELARLSPLTGVRFAYFPLPYLGVEAELSWIMTQTKMSQQSASIYGGRIQVMYQFANLHPRFVPFVALGDGFSTVRSPRTVLGNDTDWPIHVGVGARVLVHRSITVRIDGRFLRAPSQQAPYHLNASLGEFTLGVSYRPSVSPPEPPPPPPPPKVDSDGDGIFDDEDQCPNEPEDFDLFEDTDGCPDLDNDGDGIPDERDRCPNEPEDKDGFEDEDGCPDPDNDGDGIPDAMDQCPNEPEDRDGFRDFDGCPDPDNDQDGIPDAEDKCPNEPETINGFQDDDGCPDRGDPLVVVSPDRLELLEGVQFKDATIQKASFNLLGQVFAQLRAHSAILRLRITVHVQPTRDPDKDQRISEQRAHAIRDWLIAKGVDEKRLEPRGFGGSKPLVDPKQKGAKALNERVDLIILERK
jgi:outer membrane protein OmpA-like peptidoglycan-associated protein